MAYTQETTKQGRVADVEFFKRNKKDWVRLCLFGYHTKYEFCLDATTLEEALDFLDNNIAEIELHEEKYFNAWSELND